MSVYPTRKARNIAAFLTLLSGFSHVAQLWFRETDGTALLTAALFGCNEPAERPPSTAAGAVSITTRGASMPAAESATACMSSAIAPSTAAVALLVSPDSSYMTGAVLHVNGGVLMA